MLTSRRRMPSLQELVAFEAVARRANFTKAADELSLTQSAISKQIRQLEATLGLLLFDRAGGRVRLTTAGAVYLRATQEILERFRLATLSVGGGTDSGASLNVVVLPTFAERWLIPRLPRFAEACPDVTVNLTTRVEPFDSYGASYDLAIHYGAAGWTHPDAEMLCAEAFVAVASPAYCARRGFREAADLENATLLQQADRPSLWRDWFADAAAPCENPYRGPVFDRFSMTTVAAVAGLGVALVPRFFVDDEILAGRLAIVVDHTMRGDGAYHVVLPRSKRGNAFAAAFRRWVLNESASAR